MGRLVGMHEGLLNSAVFSFEKALIKDWQTFFRGEWASALLHDDFENFKQSLVDPVHGEKFVLSLMDSLSEKVASGVSDEDISKATSQILGDRCAFVPENVCAAIETPLMEFVKKYKSDFSKFQMPIMSQSNRSGRK